MNLLRWRLVTPVLLATAAAIGCGPAKKTAVVESGLSEYVNLARNAPKEDHQMQGSLWSEQAGYLDTFRDVKARRVADIVTIEVLESTSAVSEATTESAKSSAVEAQLTSVAGLEKRIAELPNLFDITTDREFSGDASTTRRSILQTSITARLVEVFPNGNLLLEGNRQLQINGERQIVTVRGVARPQDVSSQNVVLSTRIAELEVEVEGKGIVSDAQKPGILYKILSGFWPF